MSCLPTQSVNEDKVKMIVKDELDRVRRGIDETLAKWD